MFPWSPNRLADSLLTEATAPAPSAPANDKLSFSTRSPSQTTSEALPASEVLSLPQNSNPYRISTDHITWHEELLEKEKTKYNGYEDGHITTQGQN